MTLKKNTKLYTPFVVSELHLVKLENPLLPRS